MISRTVCAIHRRKRSIKRRTLRWAAYLLQLLLLVSKESVWLKIHKNKCIVPGKERAFVPIHMSQTPYWLHRNYTGSRTVPVNANGWYGWAVIPMNFQVLSKGVKCLQLSEADFLLIFHFTHISSKMLKHHLEWSENVNCCSGPPFVLCYITSLHYIAILSLEELTLTCIKWLENARLKIHQDDLMQRHHLWLRKSTNHWIHRCWESVLDKYHFRCTLGILLFSKYLLVVRGRIRG